MTIPNADGRYGPDPAEWRPEYDEYAQRVIDSHVIDPKTGEPQPDHWTKRVFVSSGRGHGKTLLLNRLRRYQ